MHLIGMDAAGMQGAARGLKHLWATQHTGSPKVLPSCSMHALPYSCVLQSRRIDHAQAPAPDSTSEAATEEGAAPQASPSSQQYDQLGADPCCFAKLFPFHFLLDQDLRVVQAGQALKKMLPALKQQGVSIADVLMVRAALP